jgi:uncharacterized membrane protein
MNKVTLLTSDCDMALYIDGKLAYEYSEVYATDVLGALHDAGIIQYKQQDVEHIIQDLMDDRSYVIFPQDLKDVNI